MRSYLDTLIEYDSQSSFKELQVKWTYFLADKLSCKEEGFSVFQNQQHQANITQLDNSRLSHSPIFECYKKVIVQLESYFETNLKIKLKENAFSWLVFNYNAKRAATESKAKYDLAQTYKKWLESNQAELTGIDAPQASYFEKFKETRQGRVLIRAIEKFYNNQFDGFSLVADDSKDSISIPDFEFNFRNQDSFINYNSKKININTSIQSIINFSEDDVYALVFRINKSRIHINGEFKGIRKMPVQLNEWCSQELIDLIVEEESIVLEEYIPKGLSENLIDTFFLKDLYLSKEVELNLSIYNSFSDAEVEYMQNNIREVFPFYFIQDKPHEVKIEKVSDEELMISLHTDSDQIIASVSKR